MALTPLSIITALARSGALDRAWALFEASGYLTATKNAAALAVKGRLLKDRALSASGMDRRAHFNAAAQAYAQADTLSPAPYLLINVATLKLLAGDAAAADDVATQVLSRLQNADDLETPYWIAATRAEAQLLSGDRAAAEVSLTQAIGHAPQSYEDHASTLRQFRLITAEQNASPDWLDAYRPPSSAHFAGHLGVAGDDEARLRKNLDALLERENIGFGFGALAAGADIIVAEALLNRGAELTAILPVAIDTFIAQSITPLGGNWRRRFDACMDHASNFIQITHIEGAFEPLTINLAGDVGMGSAILNSKRLESKAIQIVIADDGAQKFGDGHHTARDAERWSNAGHAQFILRAPRTAIRSSASIGEERPVPSRRLVACLSVHLSGAKALPESDWPRVDTEILTQIGPWAADAATKPLLIQRIDARIELVFAEVEQAARAAFALTEGFKQTSAQDPGFWSNKALSIGGHYGVLHMSAAGDTLFGPGTTIAHDIANRAHPGMICVSENFASSLAFRAPDMRLEYVGDMPATLEGNEYRLFAIKQL